jgi:hypothetical protein
MLHKALVAGDQSVSTIQQLLIDHPEVVRGKEEVGRLHLHVAIWKNSPVAIILAILKLFSEAACLTYTTDYLYTTHLTLP